MCCDTSKICCDKLKTLLWQVKNFAVAKRKIQFGYVIGVCKGYVCSVGITR